MIRQEMYDRFTQASGGQIDLNGYKVVYAWRDDFLNPGDNYALAFNPQQEHLWVLNFKSGEMREIGMQDIREVRESPSSRYQFLYRRSLKRESYYVPYLSAATSTHLYCAQWDTCEEFHQFCRKHKRDPWIIRVWKKLTCRTEDKEDQNQSESECIEV